MMVDGVILLVDAAEGPLPQTRFVLKKSLELNLPIIVVLNKIDRQDARPQEVLNEIYDLFIDLDAREEQIEFPVLYAVARDGIAKRNLEDDNDNLVPLFEEIVSTIPAPTYDDDLPFSMLVANISYSDYLGKLAIGRILQGEVTPGDQLVRIAEDESINKLKSTVVQAYQGLEIVKLTETAKAGEIVVISGAEDVFIGDTICSADNPQALPRIKVDAPTVAMRFFANTSPLSGKEGSILQPQKIGERLIKESLYNVALQVEKSPTEEVYIVKGRGELQMAILIETMRREGFELTVGRPEIIFKEEDGKRLEPIEHILIDCEEGNVGVISEKLSFRKGRMTNLVNNGSGRVRLEFSAPSRALIGFRSEFLTDTKGTGILNSYLEGYEEYRGDFENRLSGSLVSDRSGDAVAYGLFYLEDRGKMFIKAGQPVYQGMIIGEHNRSNDLNVNPCKSKKLSNMRAAGKDDNIQLSPVAPMSLEAAIDFIREDELVEVTPESIRLRKTHLDPNMRKARLSKAK